MITPEDASPTMPTPLAEPKPGQMVARAAPKIAMLLPVKICCIKSMNFIIVFPFRK
jgi:hypothetical protein